MNSISIKLFLSLFGLTAVILIATIGLARWSFNYRFNDYLNSIEENRLQRISAQLVQHYQDNGNRWTADINSYFDEIVEADFHRPESAPLLATSNEILRAALSSSLEDELQSLSILDQQEFSDALDSLEASDYPSYNPDFDVDIWQPEISTSNNPPANTSITAIEENISPTNVFVSNQINVNHSMALLDMDGIQLAGIDIPSEQDAFINELITVDGVNVGELRTVINRDLQTPLENAFSAQQKLASVSIIALSLILAAIASWLLSSMLLAPIVRLKNSIGTLANGDYGDHLNLDRKDELGMLMRDVNKLSSTLQENRVSRRGWQADISHELRTPVTIISGEIEAIKDGMREMNVNSLNSLEHEVNNLKYLIDDLYQLSLSDIGGLRYEFDRLNVGELLSTIVDQQYNRISEAGFTLSSAIEKEYWIQGDRARLQQLIINLINNAIAYTDVPGQIKIGAKIFAKEFIVWVEDSAPAIDEEFLSLMFEPLFREKKSHRRAKGRAGLGLAICRNIAIAHDAEIKACLSEMGGVKVEIRFPKITS